jgi:hypothetical protein
MVPWEPACTRQRQPSHLHHYDRRFLSDRQKGLLEGVGTWFPGSAHGYCLRHLVDNFSKHFKHKDLTKLLWHVQRRKPNSKPAAMLCVSSTSNVSIGSLTTHIQSIGRRFTSLDIDTGILHRISRNPGMLGCYEREIYLLRLY